MNQPGRQRQILPFNATVHKFGKPGAIFVNEYDGHAEEREGHWSIGQRVHQPRVPFGILLNFTTPPKYHYGEVLMRLEQPRSNWFDQSFR